VTSSVTLPRVGQFKFSSRLGRCAPGLDCVLLLWVHYQRMISNVVLRIYLFQCFLKQINCKTDPKYFIIIILHYMNACTEFLFTFQIVYHVLFLGQGSVNHPIASKLPEENKWACFCKWIRVGIVMWVFWSCTLWDLIVGL